MQFVVGVVECGDDVVAPRVVVEDVQDAIGEGGDGGVEGGDRGGGGEFEGEVGYVG